jgi:hypothetical protein
MRCIRRDLQSVDRDEYRRAKVTREGGSTAESLPDRTGGKTTRERVPQIVD